MLYNLVNIFQRGMVLRKCLYYKKKGGTPLLHSDWSKGARVGKAKSHKCVKNSRRQQKCCLKDHSEAIFEIIINKKTSLFTSNILRDQ